LGTGTPLIVRPEDEPIHDLTEWALLKPDQQVARDALTPLAYTDDGGQHPPAGAAGISEGSERRIPSFAGVRIWGRGILSLKSEGKKI